LFFFRIFVGELLINRTLTFQDVHQISLEEIKEKRGEDVLRHIFTAVDRRHGAQKLQEMVADANCDLGQFINDGNLNQWLEVNVSLKTSAIFLIIYLIILLTLQ
jgi:hypothetical protein